MSVVLNHAQIPDKQDYIQISGVPDILTNNMVLVTKYKCGKQSVVGLHIQIDTEYQTQKKIFNTQWTCNGDNEPKMHLVNVNLPDSFVYRPNYFNRRSVLVKNVRAQAWIYDQNDWHLVQHRDLIYEIAVIKVSYNIKTLPPYSRPPKPANGCPRWTFSLLSKLSVKHIPKCPYEKETLRIINYPVALNGFKYGIFHSFKPYRDPNLERLRVKEISEPRMTVSMWLYILEYCNGSVIGLCSLMYHLDWKNTYLSPLLFVTPKGKLHIQVTLRNGQTLANLTPFRLPLHQWFQIVFSIRSSEWYITINYGENWGQQLQADFQFNQNIQYNDVVGIFTFGGSDHLPSFKGYIDHVTFYRRRMVSPQKIPMPSPRDTMFELALSHRHKKCHDYLVWIEDKIEYYEELKQKIINKYACLDYFTQLRNNTTASEWQERQCGIHGGPTSARFKLVKRILWKIIRSKKATQEINLQKIGETIFENITARLEESLGTMNDTVFLLKQSACIGYIDAMYMLSVVLANGIHVKADDTQSHGYLMLASMGGHRLSSLALAHKYNYGLDAVPYHAGVAYMYYKYVADKTRQDREDHKDTDVLTESVRLTDDKLLKEQTDENGDIFMWLKHQAKQGVFSAQQHIGRALYWGAQGLKRNMESAMEYFRLGAETEDPTAMYDYGVVLMRGQGTKRDVKEGLEQIKKAAKKHNPQALNALGWYALEQEKNYTLAAEYFEKAHALGNPDGSYHVGHMHFNGLYPGLPKDVDKAYQYFVWAATMGQLEAGLMVAYQNIRGTGQLPINVQVAVEWARFIAEKNPSLGYMLRKGLHAYRNGNIPLSLFYYMMAAEAGIEVGSFNVAWLCEGNKDGFVSFIEKECQWRHYNLSTKREPQFVDPYALIKMGDYYWYGCGGKRDVIEATNYYLQAAYKGSPNAIFNLAQMVEDGVKLNETDLHNLFVPEKAQKDNISLVVELYSRCKESKESEAYIPCALALLRVQLIYVWARYHIWMKVSSIFGLALATTGLAYNLIRNYNQIELVSTV